MNRQLMRSEMSIVIDNQLTTPQCLVYDSGCIEGVRTFANVLQNQDVGAIVDLWNRRAKTKRLRTKALITSFPHVSFPFMYTGSLVRSRVVHCEHAASHHIIARQDLRAQ